MNCPYSNILGYNPLKYGNNFLFDADKKPWINPESLYDRLSKLNSNKKYCT